ncbi:hypothetical protein ACFX2G_032620 [Malus domestica]
MTVSTRKKKHDEPTSELSTSSQTQQTRILNPIAAEQYIELSEGAPRCNQNTKCLESNNQNVDSKKLENFHAKKAAFLRDVEELQSHRRVVEDFQDAEALCELASSEEHGWKVEILINDDNSGNFKREVHDAGKRVGIEVTQEKGKVLKSAIFLLFSGVT